MMQTSSSKDHSTDKDIQYYIGIKRIERIWLFLIDAIIREGVSFRFSTRISFEKFSVQRAKLRSLRYVECQKFCWWRCSFTT